MMQARQPGRRERQLRRQMRRRKRKTMIPSQRMTRMAAVSMHACRAGRGGALAGLGSRVLAGQARHCGSPQQQHLLLQCWAVVQECWLNWLLPRLPACLPSLPPARCR